MLALKLLPFLAFFLGGVDAAVLLSCAALLVATLLFVFWIDYEASDFSPLRSRLDQLLERRDSIHDNLRDLKFENRAGKYAEKDYEEMKTAMENEAALVLAEIDEETARDLARTPGSRPHRAPAGRGAE
ncbi:MAG: hypothetical protein LAN71_15870 [Acidobacteriia bacterium]|nr:hypothetical protein [Terriglobia bacterium]